MKQEDKLEKYKNLVEDYYGIDLMLKSRKTIYVQARAIYYYLCREFSSLPVTKIALSLGKTHATVLHALNELPYMRKFDSNFNKNFYEIYEIAKGFNRTEKVELTLEQLITGYNQLKIDNEVLKRRLNKYEPA
jgi:predicted transcriptional regulator